MLRALTIAVAMTALAVTFAGNLEARIFDAPPGPEACWNALKMASIQEDKARQLERHKRRIIKSWGRKQPSDEYAMHLNDALTDVLRAVQLWAKAERDAKECLLKEAEQ